MQCPNCGNDVPARPICLRCGVSLFGSPAMPASAQGPLTIPLTAGQKMQLLAGCLPVVSFTLMCVAYQALVSKAIVPPPGVLLYLVMGATILVIGYQAVQKLRDLISGVALVEEDLLNRSYRTRGAPGRGRPFGRFERLGTLRMTSKAYFQNSAGQRYRVVYSPISKIVWALEPPDQRVWS